MTSVIFFLSTGTKTSEKKNRKLFNFNLKFSFTKTKKTLQAFRAIYLYI